MAYRDSQSGGYRIAAIAIIVVVVALVVASPFLLGVLRQLDRQIAQSEVDATLQLDPGMHEIITIMQQTYPSDYQTLKGQLVAARMKSASDSELNDLTLTFLIEAGARHRGDLAHADNAHLSAYRTGDLAVMRALAEENVEDCAVYAATGAFRTRRPVPTLTQLLKDYRLTSWRGYASGHARSAVPLPPLPDNAFEQVGRAMLRNGMTPEQLARFDRLGAAAGRTPQEQCQMGITFLTAISEQPTERANALYSWLLAHG